MNKQFLILVFGLNLHAVTAYINGAVTLACTSMTPNHRNNTASILKPPYRVTTDVSNYTAGQVIKVTLQANETGFRGFLLQARDETGPVGTFTVTGSDAQLLSCGTAGSAVSHTSNVNKSTIVALWKAPNNNNTDIRFRATFVQNFSLFWVDVQSDPVRFVGTNTTVTSPHDSSPSVSLTIYLLLLPLLAII
ncbi:putative defense protein 3 [Carassius carassius]|uniref:putative defense protein 3 n=1 Tax=Carassius carassius TaxID=217509 RepID=UPI002868790E|nr:putative defense protein 3 [Carassius carassius]